MVYLYLTDFRRKAIIRACSKEHEKDPDTSNGCRTYVDIDSYAKDFEATSVANCQILP